MQGQEVYSEKSSWKRAQDFERQGDTGNGKGKKSPANTRLQLLLSPTHAVTASSADPIVSRDAVACVGE